MPNDNYNSFLRYYSNQGLPQLEWVKAQIEAHKNSEQYTIQKKNIRASKNLSDIQDKKRYTFSTNATYSDGNVRPGQVNFANHDEPVTSTATVNPYAPCNKLEHAYYRKLITQKINYLLGSPYSLSTQDLDYLKVLEDFFSPSLRSLVKELARQSIIHGVAYVYAQVNQDGQLELIPFDSQNCIALWNDSYKTKLEGFIRYYTVELYNVNNPIEYETRIELYTQEGIYRYVDSKATGFKMLEDSPSPYISLSTLDNNYYASWDTIPIIPIRYNKDELTLYQIVGTLIEDYNLKTSHISDFIDELGQPLTVVKGYDDNSRDDFARRLRESKVVFTQSDGDVNTVPVNADSALYADYLARLRKSIYDLAGGVDLQNANISNTSGVALKLMFADLDLDCRELADNLEEALQAMIQYYTKLYNIQHNTNYDASTVTIEFNPSLLVNESEVIDNITKSQGLLPIQELLNQHPWVKNVADTLSQLEAEKQANLDLYATID